MNLWHFASDYTGPLGVIEMPKGSFLKYEIEKNTGCLTLDRVLSLPVPANYGFIPQTLSDDGDPLDVFVYSSFSVDPLTVVKLKVERYLHTMDNGVEDSKVVATILGDKLDWHAVDRRVKATIYYLENYKKGMKVIDVLDHKVANLAIKIAKSKYNQKFLGGLQ